MKSRNGVCLFISRHRYRIILACIGFVFIAINLNIFGYTQDLESPDKLREEILRLSEMYVNILSKEEQNIVDGPFSGHLTGHDLRKTFAVILENLLNRINRLEREVIRLKSSDCARNSSSNDSRKPVHESMTAVTISQENRDLAIGSKVSENASCRLTDKEEVRYPHCMEKMAWMANFWSSDPCYSAYGVDGSDCSFRIYLSEIELWCPPIPDRGDEVRLRPFPSSFKKADWNFGLDGLLDLLHDPGHRNNYGWMRTRISLLWDRWVSAAKNLTLKQDFSNRQQQRILIHLGFLSSKSGFKIPEMASRGGPLGELVQWSDVIAALYLLGHNLTITSEYNDLIRVLNQLPNAESQCQVRSQLPVDMIYTDIVGLIQFKRKVRAGYGKFSCLLRIVDSFGTEAMFNHAAYAKLHKRSTTWGKQNLNLRQFFTMFPHSPDNSFMGFVVDRHLNDDDYYDNVTKRQQAVVYGKDAMMWEGREDYLSVIRKYVDIHGTVFLDDRRANSVLPDFVQNHGILSGPDLHRLLLESKLFIGLGFPYEGPAPLEAIALGCVFINPKFHPPRNSENTLFFKGKPTLRTLASQHPYTEDFIAEPHVYTVDINNLTEVEAAVKKALQMIDNRKVGMYLPYEFTHEGMLQRLHAYIQHQDFCSVLPNVFPPTSSVDFIASEPGQSCKDACWKRRRMCEYSHFGRLNNRATLEQFLGAPCSDVRQQSDVFFPALEYAAQRCYLQDDPLLFSCVGGVEGVVRICPCRDFIRGQTALCSSCT